MHQPSLGDSDSSNLHQPSLGDSDGSKLGNQVIKQHNIDKWYYCDCVQSNDATIPDLEYVKSDPNWLTPDTHDPSLLRKITLTYINLMNWIIKYICNPYLDTYSNITTGIVIAYLLTLCDQ